MVKIMKGDSLLTVPRGAFHNYYEAQGYKLLGASMSPDNDTGMFTGVNGQSPDSGHTATSGDYTREQVMSMTLDQLYEVADELGLDYQEVKTKDDLIKLIIRQL